MPEAVHQPAEVLRMASHTLNASRVLIINDADSAARQNLRRESAAILGARAAFTDDFVPLWYATDFDTPSEHATHALAAIELRLCAKARHFMGSLAAPSTHAVCHLRGARSAGMSKRGSCDDAFGRSLPARSALF